MSIAEIQPGTVLRARLFNNNVKYIFIGIKENKKVLIPFQPGKEKRTAVWITEMSDKFFEVAGTDEQLNQCWQNFNVELYLKYLYARMKQIHN